MSKKPNYDEIVAKYDVQTKLEITAWVLSKLQEHCEGGSYRTLIYERLGFSVDAYEPLLEAGGMEVSNALFEAAKTVRRRGK